MQASLQVLRFSSGSETQCSLPNSKKCFQVHFFDAALFYVGGERENILEFLPDCEELKRIWNFKNPCKHGKGIAEKIQRVTFPGNSKKTRKKRLFGSVLQEAQNWKAHVCKHQVMSDWFFSLFCFYFHAEMLIRIWRRIGNDEASCAEKLIQIVLCSWMCFCSQGRFCKRRQRNASQTNFCSFLPDNPWRKETTLTHVTLGLCSICTIWVGNKGNPLTPLCLT